MKKSFYYIITGLLLALLIVFGWQVLLLHGLYMTLEEELKRDLIKQIEVADQFDLLRRLKMVENRYKQKNFEKVISISGKTDDDGQYEFEKEERYVDRRKDDKDTTVIISQVNPKGPISISEHLIKSINESIHDAVDIEEPIDLQRIDSVYRQNLLNSQIHITHYYTELYDQKNDSLLSTTFDASQMVKKRETPTFTYSFGAAGRYCYRVYMEPLTQTVLIRMGGILLTTVLIMLILDFTFWYLIRTLFKQKTLEEMKDDFTNNMTHELKTPIAVAYAATDSLLNFDLSKDEEKRRKYLQICRDQLMRLSHLVEQILSMSMEQRKSFQLHPEEIPVKELINGLVEQHKLKSDKPVTFTVSCATDSEIVYADRTHLSNMLSNLIDNAIKYSGEQVNIRIDARRKNNRCEFRVSDNGPGIPHDKQAHIFDKYYRIPNGNLHTIKGYGLGLFYVKVMAEKHGGQVAVKSAPGKGSTFIIQLPINPEIS